MFIFLTKKKKLYIYIHIYEENIDEIKDPLKREEERLKQSLEKGSTNIQQPLTDKRKQLVNEKESCFKVGRLSRVTEQMVHNKAEYGRPCVAKAHTKFIAVGMEKGAVFVFDHFEQLSGVLPVTEAESPGSVTTIAFSHNGQSLVVGHKVFLFFFFFSFLSMNNMKISFVNGGLVLWDIINKKELKRIRDAHSAPVVYSNFFKSGQMK
ncbi:hypothetical protein RFI_00936, partial [Reticulomyxa filosa]